MIYVVTGLCLLVSFAICVFSLVYAENRKQKEAVLEAVEASEESSEEQESEDKKIGENSDEENKGTKQDASLRTTFFYKIKTLTVLAMGYLCFDFNSFICITVFRNSMDTV